jgi:hypothetical protein
MPSSRKGLFSGGSRSLLSHETRGESQLAEKESLRTHVKADLLKRRLQKKAPPEVGLAFSVLGHGKYASSYHGVDFNDVVRLYPHHRQLSLQLLSGAFLLIPRLALPTFARMFLGFRDFLTFLNSHRWGKRIRVVAHVTVAIARAFNDYVVTKQQMGNKACRSHRAVAHCIGVLQREFHDDPNVGIPIQWPVGPRRVFSVRNGYKPEAFLELIKACQEDIGRVKALHRFCTDAQSSDEVFLQEEWNLPNAMWFLQRKIETRLPLHRTLEERIRLLINGRPSAIRYLAKHNLTVENISRRYQKWTQSTSRSKVDSPTNCARKWTAKTISCWLHSQLSRDAFLRRTEEEIIKEAFRSCGGLREFARVNKWTVEDLLKYYTNTGKRLAILGRNPLGQGIDQNAAQSVKESYFRMLLTTLAKKFPEYPCNMDYESAKHFLSENRYQNMTIVEKRSLEGRIFNLLFHGHVHFIPGVAGRSLLYAALHFLAETLYPFLLHVQINTGWNLESIVALTDDVESHTCKDLVDPDNFVVLISTKHRGAKHAPKPIYHRSNRHNQFGTYQILKYVEAIVRKYKGQKQYFAGALWQYIPRPGSSTGKTRGRQAHARRQIVKAINSSNTAVLFRCSRSFVKRHAFKHYKSDGIDHGRIRTTYETMREIQGLPLDAIAFDMHHNEIRTTEKHYASDTSSNDLKSAKIAALQSQLVDACRNYACRLQESTSLAELREAISTAKSASTRRSTLRTLSRKLGVPETKVVHLLSPGAQTYIAVCHDANNPTWPGHEHVLTKNEKCVYFDRCVFCTQAMVFAETLPYIAKRIFDLDEKRRNMNPYAWLRSFGAEHDAWAQILVDWTDQSLVTQAQNAARKGEIDLPVQMKGVG